MDNKKNSVLPQDPSEVRKIAGMFQDLLQSPTAASSDTVSTAEPVQTSEFASSGVLNRVKDKEVHGKHDQ